MLGRLVGTQTGFGGGVGGAEEEGRASGVAAMAVSTQRGPLRGIQRPLLEARPAGWTPSPENMPAENSKVLVNFRGNSGKMLNLIQKLGMGAEALHLSPAPS